MQLKQSDINNLLKKLSKQSKLHHQQTVNDDFLALLKSSNVAPEAVALFLNHLSIMGSNQTQIKESIK
jgi:hypothetical protein